MKAEDLGKAQDYYVENNNGSMAEIMQGYAEAYYKSKVNVKDINHVRQTISLLSSMVRSGEDFSNKSLNFKDDALNILNKLLKQ